MRGFIKANTQEIHSKKIAFVLDFLKKEKYIDVFNRDFIDAYISEFNPKHKLTMIGAYKVPEVSKLLLKMYKQGLISRNRIGLSKSEGFPSWCYVYEIVKN